MSSDQTTSGYYIWFWASVRWLWAGVLTPQREAAGVQLGEGMTSGAPNSNPGTDGSDGGDVGSLFSSAWQEGERQQHKLKHERLRLEIGKSLLHEDSPAVDPGPREVGSYLALGGVYA